MFKAAKMATFKVLIPLPDRKTSSIFSFTNWTTLATSSSSESLKTESSRPNTVIL